MEDLYKIAGVSRQGILSASRRVNENDLLVQRIRDIVIEARKDHPKMSARKVHKMLRIDWIGINKFEALVSAEGLGVKPYRSAIRTTRSGIYDYPNLTHNLSINDINQLWASDITYFITPESVYYIVLIIDVYSRRIIGYAASDNLEAINNVAALKMAFQKRKLPKIAGLIHHSDKGSQYGSKIYLKMLEDADARISMAQTSIENGYAERVIGIIKNEYLYSMSIHSLKQLRRAVEKSIRLYNTERPHMEIGYLSPIEFEKKIKECPAIMRKAMTLYDFRVEHAGFLEAWEKENGGNKTEKPPRKEVIFLASDYSSEGCSSAEPSSASPERNKVEKPKPNETKKLSTSIPKV